MTKVVLVTGASSGLGRALCEHLSEHGYRVYGTSRKPAGYQVSFPLLALDVTDPASVRRAVDQVLAEAGRIDVLVNNAGVSMAAPLEMVPLEDAERLFQVNVFGMLRASQAVLPHMRAAGSGMIINISSIGSTVGLPLRGLYCASKAAVDMLSETLRLEVGRFGIQLCTILAGDMRTPIKDNWIGTYRGEDATYGREYHQVTEAVGAGNAKGMEPRQVAEQIEELIRSGRLRRRSRAIGKPLERLAITAKRLLPTAWFEKIILNHSKLDA
jgi:NAD(P)-dependent dehydrogenase (short-subunit alcohol dehydrogenase family)